MIKRLLLIIVLILLVLVSGCATSADPPQAVPPAGQEEVQREPEGSENEDGSTEEIHVNYVTIKYRDTPVNIAAPHFEYLNTDVSSFIRGAWYDEQNRYLVMNIDGTYYNYCGVPESVWRGFKQSDSYGRFFNASIKESYEYKNCVGPDY